MSPYKRTGIGRQAPAEPDRIAGGMTTIHPQAVANAGCHLRRKRTSGTAFAASPAAAKAIAVLALRFIRVPMNPLRVLPA